MYEFILNGIAYIGENIKNLIIGILIIFLLRMVFAVYKKIYLKKWTKNNFININYVRTLDGFQFEDYIAKQLNNLGIKVRKTPKSGDFGIDIILGDEYAVQLKNYRSTVGISAIQEAYAGAAYYNKKPVVLITNYYTKSAIELADRIGVELIDLDDIKNWGNVYYKRSYPEKKGAYEYIAGYLKDNKKASRL